MKLTLKTHQLVQVVDFILDHFDAEANDADVLEARVSLKLLTDKNGDVNLCAWLEDEPSSSTVIPEVMPEDMKQELLAEAREFNDIGSLALTADEIASLKHQFEADFSEETEVKQTFASTYYDNATISFTGMNGNVILSECNDPEDLTFTLGDPNQLAFSFGEKQDGL